MSDELPTSPEGWAAVIAGLIAIAKGTQLVIKRTIGGGREADYKAMAEAFFAEKRQEDREHREALIAAIVDSNERVVRAVHDEMAATRREIIDVNEHGRERFIEVMGMLANAMTAANTKLDILVSRMNGK